jgi:hypothetical protein
MPRSETLLAVARSIRWSSLVAAPVLGCAAVIGTRRAGLAVELGLALAAVAGAFVVDDEIARILPAAPAGARLRLGLRTALILPATVAGWTVVMLVSRVALAPRLPTGAALAGAAVVAAAAAQCASGTDRDLSFGAIGAGAVLAGVALTPSLPPSVLDSWPTPVLSGWPAAALLLTAATALTLHAATEPPP